MEGKSIGVLGSGVCRRGKNVGGGILFTYDAAKMESY